VRHGWRIIVLLALAAAAFLVRLDEPDIVTSHEARVAQPARQMAASGWPWAAKPVPVPRVRLTAKQGMVRLMPLWDEPPMPVNPWLVPVLDGQVRLQKPPLPYWCAAILFREFGFSEWAVRLVPALLGVFATFVILDLGRQLFGRTVGWCAALVWVSTYSIPEMYRKAMADPYLGFFTLLCVWTWVRASAAMNRADRDNPVAAASRRSDGIWTIAFYVSLGFALLAKGPPAFATVLVPIVAYHVCFRQRVPARAIAHVIGILIVLAIALPWPLYVVQHVPHAIDVWRYESVGEFADNTENARPWWFYVPELFYLSLPWTAVWIAGCALPFIRRGRRLTTSSGRVIVARFAQRARPDRRAWFPLAWWGAEVLFFSCVHLKKNQYLLPAIPAQALMIALAMSALLAWARRLKLRGNAGVLPAFQAILGVGFAIAIGALVAFYGHPARAWIAAPAFCVALLPWLALRRQRVRTWLVAQSIAYVAVLLIFVVYVTQPLDNQRSAKPVAAELLALSREPDHTILVSHLPEEVATYLPLDLKYGPQSKVLVIVDDMRGTRERQQQRHSSVPVPTENAFARMLPDEQVEEVRRIPMKSAPGDARWKVYQITVKRTGIAMR
jgi:4-amino-4-deoxy-L-arabinose transferase-like glycosyltransferase